MQYELKIIVTVKDGKIDNVEEEIHGEKTVYPVSSVIGNIFPGNAFIVYLPQDKSVWIEIKNKEVS
jgi:hypothetical protein